MANAFGLKYVPPFDVTGVRMVCLIEQLEFKIQRAGYS
jgi:hypothetical protein